VSWIRCENWRKRWCVTTRMRSERGGIRLSIVGVVRRMSIHVVNCFFTFLRVHDVHARGAPFRAFVRAFVRSRFDAMRCVVDRVSRDFHHARRAR
jgi:hypothetical protein